MIWILYILLLLMALCIGSFLNVLIHRGPALWGLEDLPADTKKATLSWPPSHCPACNKPIRLHHLLPIFGFVLLRGKCADCAAPISVRYLIVELLALGAAGLVLARWGVSLEALAAFAFLAMAIALSVIDLRLTYLPDALTLPLILLGLIANAASLFVPFTDALIGAVVGYGVFWLVSTLYEKLRGASGLGLGDAKMLAALGAWLGWYALPFVVLIASLAGLVVILLMKIMGKSIQHDTAIPFGPFLAISGSILLLLSGTGFWVL